MSRQEQLRKRARELLESKQVVMVVGYRAASTKGKAQPAFITKPEDTASLIFDETCGQNLAGYLLKVKHLGKIAVVAKGCDSRSILVLLKEKQLDRAQLYILGVGCARVTEDGKLSDSCTTCEYPNPVVCDEMLGEPAPPREIANRQSPIALRTSAGSCCPMMSPAVSAATPAGRSVRTAIVRSASWTQASPHSAARPQFRHSSGGTVPGT
jgi:hypothetical protein